jgi:hypothetical protein
MNVPYIFEILGALVKVFTFTFIPSSKIRMKIEILIFKLRIRSPSSSQFSIELVLSAHSSKIPFQTSNSKNQLNSIRNHSIFIE